MGQEQLCRPRTGEVGDLSELLPTHIGTRLQMNREDRDAVPRSTMSVLKNHGRRIAPGKVRLVCRGLKKFDGPARVSVVVEVGGHRTLRVNQTTPTITDFLEFVQATDASRPSATHTTRGANSPISALGITRS